MRILLNIIFWILMLVSIIYVLTWLFSVRSNPVAFGISFSHKYAESLGLNWRETYTAMLTDLQPKYIRIAAMWNEVEPEAGNYFFDHIDFMLDEAIKHNARVVLVVGQKAPRWPECNIPTWIEPLPIEQRQAKLLAYVNAVVERYKSNPALEYWQVENEPFIRFAFGECSLFDKQVVTKEIELVKNTDVNHQIMITDSGELSTWFKASRVGDVFGTTLYRIVRLPSGKTWSYDFLLPGFYKIKALLYGRSGRDFFISELQAEPWFADGSPQNTPLSVQQETMTINRFYKHIAYAQHVGASRAYLWGVEWWYWVKTKQNDSSFWEAAKTVLTITP